jgi:hypothetical protein
MITWVLGALALIFLVLFAISARRNLQLIDKLDEVGDQVDESLEVLNECYGRIARTADTPVMSDEPLIRELMNDIRLARDAVLLVANKLVSFDQEEDDSKE